MLESIHKAFLAGVGLAALTKEKVGNVIDDLVDKGKITEDQGREIVEELKKKVSTSKTELEDTVKKLVNEALQSLDVPTKEDIDKINQRLDNLESRQ